MLLQRITRYLAILIGTALFALGLMIGWVQLGEINHIVPLESVQPSPVAIVLGASVKTDGTASDALFDRVVVAATLYREGKVEKLLMTGDDGEFHVNEVATMKHLAIAQGVPEEQIMIDGHGYRTYESCKRASQTLGIKEAIIVTQRFHLGRALYLCHAFGMNVQGVSADRQHYVRIFYFTIRDLLASAKAWWDIHVEPPDPPVPYQE